MIREPHELPARGPGKVFRAKLLLFRAAFPSGYVCVFCKTFDTNVHVTNYDAVCPTCHWRRAKPTSSWMREYLAGGRTKSNPRSR